jgi:hypothetical protein
MSAANAMKITTRQRFRRIAADQRIVGHAIRFDLQGGCRMTENIQRGAHDLRLAAQTIGILHAIIAGKMRGTDRAA